MHHDTSNNIRPPFDKVITDMAEYVLNYKINSTEAVDTARYCLLDTLACGFMALAYPACTKLLGPVVPGATLKDGARIPGTAFQLEPIQAAFNIGAMVRWLDFNDTWLAAEWGHPSDNLGALLAVMDYLERDGKKTFKVRDLLDAMIKAHELQGVMALENAFNKVGLDHVVLVKIASTAVATHLFGGDKEKIQNALSLAWVDGQSLRTYRHAPNTGSRKSWAAGDATSRAVRLALIAMTGEMGYPGALTAPNWGFYDNTFKGNEFKLSRPYGSYVMENILFKISFPAEFHAQTAVECAMTLHPQVKDRLNDIDKIVMKTQEAGMRIIDKKGPLHNPADRDHCIQYMAAIGLIFGKLTAEHYEDAIAKDPRIDALRAKMEISEEPRFTKDYFDPEKRAIGNSIQVFFKDGTSTDLVEVDYPIGHRRRRKDGIPLLMEKFEGAVNEHFVSQKARAIMDVCTNPARLDDMSVAQFMDLFVVA